MPPNLQTVSLKFARRRSAKVMGALAFRDSEPVEGEEVQGILVTHNFHSKIVKPEDLATYTPLRVGSISSKLHVPFAGSIETLKLFFNEMFAGVTETADGEGADGASVTKFGLHQDKVSMIIIVQISFRFATVSLIAWLLFSTAGHCCCRQNKRSGDC
jgi:hypothetical protein